MSSFLAPPIETDDAPLLSKQGTHGAYIHPRDMLSNPSYRFCSESVVWKRLHTTLLEYAGMWERLLASVFGNFLHFFSNNWEFKGRLISFLYCHMVYPDNDDELHFNFGGKGIKFGKREFAFITGFKFRDYNLPINRESRCLEKPSPLSVFADTDTITLKKIIDAIQSRKCDDETVYRMALVYVFHGVVMALEYNTTFSKDIFYVMEDLERVENFPWGVIVYNNFLLNWRKQIPELMKFGPRDEGRDKPSIFGCIHALQIWAFHSIPWTMGKSNGNFVNLIDDDRERHPTILRWKCTKSGVTNDTVWNNIKQIEKQIVADVLTTDEDKRYVVSIGLPEEVVFAPPRALPVPRLPPAEHVIENEPHRAPTAEHGISHERPLIDADDGRLRQIRRVEQASTSAETDTIVGGVELNVLKSMVQQLVEEQLSVVNEELAKSNLELAKTNLELARLKKINFELADTRAQLSVAKTEIAQLHATVERLSTEHAKLQLEIQNIRCSNTVIREAGDSQCQEVQRDPTLVNLVHGNASAASEHKEELQRPNPESTDSTGIGSGLDRLDGPLELFVGRRARKNKGKQTVLNPSPKKLKTVKKTPKKVTQKNQGT